MRQRAFCLVPEILNSPGILPSYSCPGKGQASSICAKRNYSGQFRDVGYADLSA